MGSFASVFAIFSFLFRLKVKTTSNIIDIHHDDADDHKASIIA